MKIDRNRPLPTHTKLKIEECLAKVILEKLFPDRYGALEIADKPDLRDTQHDIGIEVTSAESAKEREADRLWTTTNYMDESAKKERNVDRLRQLGIEYTGGVQLWPIKSFCPSQLETSPAQCFFQAYLDKVQKLNQGHYAEMNEYDLFVHYYWFIWPYEPSSWMPVLLEKMMKGNDNPHRFSYVYLLGFTALYIWNLVSRSYKVIPKDDHFWHYSWDARELVIQKEESGE